MQATPAGMIVPLWLGLPAVLGAVGLFIGQMAQLWAARQARLRDEKAAALAAEAAIVQSEIRRDVNSNMTNALKRAEEAAATITAMTKAATEAASAAATAATQAATAATALIQKQVDDFKAIIAKREEQDRDDERSRPRRAR